jgi:hypothetical protein
MCCINFLNTCTNDYYIKSSSINIKKKESIKFLIYHFLKDYLSMDEVNFVQQFVFYIEYIYRIPDYSICERGDEYNTNTL